MGPLISLFWTSGDICPGFQSRGGFPRLCASSPAHNGLVVATLNSSMVVGTLKSSIKCYMGAWAKEARQGVRQDILEFKVPTTMLGQE